MNDSERVLDWRPRHDPRSRNYPIREALPPVSVPPAARMWRMGPVLDQGREGACVGFGWTAELMASPMPWWPTNPVDPDRVARDIYRRAQRIDEWPGENYEGTSVLAGAKIVREDGHVDGYRWAFTPDDVRDTVVHLGPVVIGVWWYESMFHPRRSGLLEVHGRKVGGHCLTVTGYHPRMRLGKSEGWFNRFEVFRLRQSWGRGHGKKGDVFVRADDLYRLLADQGEACVPTGRRPVRFAR